MSKKVQEVIDEMMGGSNKQIEEQFTSGIKAYMSNNPGMTKDEYATAIGQSPVDTAYDATVQVPGVGNINPLVTKMEAEYESTHQYGYQCTHCKFFINPTACTVVQGVVRPEGGCSLFERDERRWAGTGRVIPVGNEVEV